jgi:hypothetical protein
MRERVCVREGKREGERVCEKEGERECEKEGERECEKEGERERVTSARTFCLRV